jgi:hypothetical protein
MRETEFPAVFFAWLLSMTTILVLYFTADGWFRRHFWGTRGSLRMAVPFVIWQALGYVYARSYQSPQTDPIFAYLYFTGSLVFGGRMFAALTTEPPD